MDRAVRLVIADDDASMRTLLRTSVELLSAVDVVGEAADGVEAVELTVKRHPDVALLDVNMPRVDGFEAAELIGRVRPQTRVLLHTAEMTTEKQFRARSLGVRLVDKLRLEEMLEFAARPPRAAQPPLGRVTDQFESAVLLALAERAGEGVVIVRPDLAVPYYNRAAARLLGLPWPSAETTVAALDERDGALGVVARVLAVHRPASEIVTLGGPARTLRVTAVPLLDANDAFVGIGAYVQALDPAAAPDHAAR